MKAPRGPESSRWQRRLERRLQRATTRAAAAAARNHADVIRRCGLRLAMARDVVPAFGRRALTKDELGVILGQARSVIEERRIERGSPLFPSFPIPRAGGREGGTRPR